MQRIKPVPGARQAFKYQADPKPPRAPLNRLRPVGEDEALTGLVQGQAASDIEERLARALDKHGATERYDFQESYAAPRNIPGEIRPDFIVYLGGATAQPLQPDGEYAHKSAEQKEEDRVKDARLDEILRGTGALPTIRIAGTDLETQAEADAWVEENLL